MRNDGTELEDLVAIVESLELPEGFEVKTREKIFDESGVQIAEFDIEIRGQLGTTEISWLIECRDRPSEGAAPGLWIQQLHGKGVLFKFNKVTAVSTTGFSSGAKQAAVTLGIELREVRSLAPQNFDWLRVSGFDFKQRQYGLLGLRILIAPDELQERQMALSEALGTAVGDVPFLRVVNTSEVKTANVAFAEAVDGLGNAFDDVPTAGATKAVRFTARYLDDNSHFVVDTKLGEVRVREIDFTGELSVVVSRISSSASSEYLHTEGDSIAQSVVFEPQEVAGIKFAIELHRMSESGVTHVLLRKLKK